MTGLLVGATYPFRALALLQKKPRLLLYILFPIFINLLLGIGLYVGLLFPGIAWISQTMATLSTWLTAWEASLPTWLDWLSNLAHILGWLLQAFLILGLFATTGFLLAQFGTLLGAPWYGQLSEQVERLRLGQLNVVEVGLVRDIGRALQFELKKLCIALGASLLVLGLNLLPGVGSAIATFPGLAVAALLVSLDFLDGPLERRRLKFRHKLGLILRNWPLTLSFSTMSLMLVSIPLVNLVSVPLCIVAGNLLFCDRLWPKHFEQTESSRRQAEPG